MNIAIFGSTGYLGLELIEIFSSREDVKIVYTASSKKEAGKLEDAQIAFLALPHQQSMELVPKLLPSMEFGVIDLSGAFRLKNPSAYLSFYGWEHCYPSLLKEAVYGLPERNRAFIRKARLIANPGCYETAIIFGLEPLIIGGLITSNIRIDALSGYTGAGKGAEIPKSITPYKGGRQHQHIPAIEQELDIPGRIFFYPNVTPFPRGILATIQAKLNTELTLAELQSIYNDFYAKEPFIRVKPEIKLDEVIRTNFCDIACQIRGRWTKIIVVIDNLRKGGSGQAIQNLNIILGLPETKGLL